MSFISLKDIPKQLGLKKGDKIFVSSAVKELIHISRENGDYSDLNVLIDAFIREVGEEGTVIFPAYNWDWCGGSAFDYFKTPSKVGALSQTALERKDFKRTKHPIYSFAVWGKDQDKLCSMENVSAFGEDSPFAYFKEYNVKNIIINVELKHSFTFVHYVEEQLLDKLTYRYLKNFRSDYTDETGVRSKKVYSMCVRSYWYEVQEEVDYFEEEFIREGAQKNVEINGIKFSVIELEKTYPIIKRDILENNSRKLCTFKGQSDSLSIADRLYGIVCELFPLCRSITGVGFRNSLQILKSHMPLIEIHEVPSGTEVYDWVVPAEWNIEEGYIEDESGKRIIDFKENNLHVVGYSYPMDVWLSLEELKKIVYTEKAQPDVIPYVTSYYKERSGFCMSKHQLDSLCEGKYHAVIKSDLNSEGVLTYGEIYFPGEKEEEILISTYLCHPSMANNECSGPAVATFLAIYVASMKKRKYSYRFLFLPETIGSITWLSRNYELLHLKENVIAGFVLSCVGDERTYSFVSTKYGNTLTDRLLRNVLKYHFPSFQEYSFLHRGSDERQYNAPGIDLPVCSVCRSKYGTYPEYHTSADDLSFVTSQGLFGSYELMIKCIEALEHNEKYKVKVLCEPQLGRRNMYPTVSQKGSYDGVKTMTDFITFCDGTNDLIAISDLIGVDVLTLLPVIEQLKEAEII
ncbi:MAG: DUF4910 domain-containing protein [Acetatifactor sp.]|nr:DUF4910 domain-containing protein [Acetatifactor sp.]